MTPQNHHLRRPWRAVARGAALSLASTLLLSACGGLLPKPQAAPALYTLEGAAAPPVARAPRAGAPTLLVALPQAAAGHDTRLIVYQRQAQRIDYFAASEWAAPPATMLAPLLVRAAEETQAFHSVLRAPANASTELRLDTELVRLSQDFSARPSRVRLSLRAMLVDVATRRVLATQDFETSAAAISDDAVGGVAAAQQAASLLAREVAAFCVAAARR